MLQKLSALFTDPKTKNVKMMIPFIKEGIIFDMGCVGGIEKCKVHKLLVEKFKNSKVVGVDISKHECVDYVFDLNNKFPKNWKADTIIAAEVIEHLFQPYQFIEECYKILRPGGRFIITTPNMLGIHYLFGKDMTGIKNRDYIGHIFAWDLQMMKDLMQNVGFKVIHASNENIYYTRNLLFRILGTLIPKIRPKLFLVGKKV